ncbi:MAG: O-antigen ligase family protein [Thermoguttaceae bacterium]|nr:O-antigen ligase family protein [Thermoguttaceae bacterium]
MTARALRGILLGLIAFLWVVSLVLAPEGSVRGGDLLTENLGWLLAALSLGVFLLVRPTVFSGADGFMALFALFSLLSWIALVKGNTGNRFYAACQSGTILLLPVSYFVLRFFPRQEAGALPLNRLLGIFLLALFFAQSLFAVYCYEVRDPALRAQYHADPEKMLADNSLVIPAGTPERELFENRLNSVEPLGTFGLTNTLAGFLVPALVFLVTLFIEGICRLIFLWRANPDGGKGKRRVCLVDLLVLAPTLAIGGYALFLTKSRTGVLALFCGVLLALLIIGLRRVPKFFRLALAASPILLALLLLAGLACGILDREFFTEAKKSLGFRLDYWQAAARMTAEYPWLGVGPGNFQPMYTRFMNASASEVIADPHNFAFEISSLLGLPALVALLAFLLKVGYQALRAGPDSEPMNSPEGEKPMGLFRSLFWGLFFAAACFAAFFLSMQTDAPIDFDFLLCALAAIPPALFLGERFLTRTLPRRWLLPAWMAGGINLLAAGGIFYPPTALPLILLAAAMVPLVETLPEKTAAAKRLSAERTGRWVFGAVVAALLACTVGIWRTAIVSGDAREMENRFGHLSEEALEQLSGELKRGALPCGLGDCVPLRMLCLDSTADVLRQHLASGGARILPSLLSQKQALFEVIPPSASIRFHAGKLLLSLGESARGKTRVQLLQEAERAFAEAVERFPSNAEYRLYHALALGLAGNRVAGKEEYARGIALDEAMTHSDRKLKNDLKERAADAVR